VKLTITPDASIEIKAAIDAATAIFLWYFFQKETILAFPLMEIHQLALLP
jgi:hypothetical protein